MHFSLTITEHSFDCKVRKLSAKTISNYQRQLRYDASNAYVLKWFKKTFPSYGKQPERDADLKIVNTPANYDEEAA